MNKIRWKYYFATQLDQRERETGAKLQMWEAGPAEEEGKSE